MGQTWRDLLFAHWPVPADAMRPLVPQRLRIETYGGDAWLGVTPFLVTGMRVRGTIPIPGLSEFVELNVRTYVTDGEKPGIWFFSLDASSRAAVAAARRVYRLPYRRARAHLRRAAGEVLFSSTRTEPGSFPRTLRTRYQAERAPFVADAGTLEHFLTERYCHYAEHEGRVFRADIHHAPWQLREAQVTIHENSMPPPPLAVSGKPLTHVSDRQDTLIWPLEPVD